MTRPVPLPQPAPAWLSRRTVALAVARRDDATSRGRSAEAVRRAVQSTILGVHIALPQTMIDEAVAWTMAWREIRLASPPAELLVAGQPRGALAVRLASKGIPVGVLQGLPAPVPTLLAAAE